MLLWTDIESNGFNHERGIGLLFEIAVLLTDDDLKPIGTGASLVVALEPDEDKEDASDMLATMEPAVVRMHAKNGLLADLYAGAGVPSVDLEGELFDALSSDLVTAKDQDHLRLFSVLPEVQLAGSTVSFDRKWIKRYCPLLEALLSHRNVDVSTITELAKRWAPELYANRPWKDTKPAHRAMDDLKGSIAQLDYYRKAGFLNASMRP